MRFVWSVNKEEKKRKLKLQFGFDSSWVEFLKRPIGRVSWSLPVRTCMSYDEKGRKTNGNDGGFCAGEALYEYIYFCKALLTILNASGFTLGILGYRRSKRLAFSTKLIMSAFYLLI